MSRTTKRGLALLALLAIAAPLTAEGRRLRHRPITVTDASESVPTLHVAPGYATVLVFQAPTKDATFARSAGALFQRVARTDRTVVVVPKQVVRKPVALSVAMADGTILTFAFVTVPNEVDAQVDVTVAVGTSSDSPAALKAEVASLRAQLDECQGTSEKAGAAKIAALILAQGLDTPQAFETHALRGADRQSRLLVQARRRYRLVGLTFVVLSVDNRDPQRSWVLGNPVVRMTGGKDEVELAVVTYASELQELPPDKEERVVVAFKTPGAVGPDHRLSIALPEKDGGRRAELKGLEF